MAFIAHFWIIEGLQKHKKLTLGQRKEARKSTVAAVAHAIT